jgi:hypothetical protein
MSPFVSFCFAEFAVFSSKRGFKNKRHVSEAFSGKQFEMFPNARAQAASRARNPEPVRQGKDQAMTTISSREPVGRTKVFFYEKLFGQIVSDQELLALTADQLRDAIGNRGLTVVCGPDDGTSCSSLNLIDETESYYSFEEAPEPAPPSPEKNSGGEGSRPSRAHP